SGYYRKSGDTQHLKIWGSQGRIEIDSGDWESMKFVSTAGESLVTRELTRPEGFDFYRDFVREAVRASMGGGEPPLTSDESLRVLRVVFGLYEASEKGEVVEVAR